MTTLWPRTVNGLYKTELIYFQNWTDLAQVEFATNELGSLVEH